MVLLAFLASLLLRLMRARARAATNISILSVEFGPITFGGFVALSGFKTAPCGE
jgi:hypothetical protein